MSSSRLPGDASGEDDAPSSSERHFPKDRLSVLHWLGLILAAVMLALLVLPVVLRKRVDEGTPAAIINLRQVHLALLDFAEDYGRFPDASTIPAVQKNTGTTLLLGDQSANELFRQLFAVGNKSEKIFWANTSFTPRKPDDILGEKTLLPGECSFTYVVGLSPTDPEDTPLLMAGVIPGTWKLDPKTNKKRGTVLFIDGSVKSYALDKDGHIMLNGMNFFDPRQPHWHGKQPDLKWPK
jgi:hypothetical protein